MDAVSEGIDAQATVAVKVKTSSEKIYTGKGSHTDIVVASVKSYVNALNKIVAGREKIKVVL